MINKNHYAGIVINLTWDCDMFNRRTDKAAIHQRKREISKTTGVFFCVAPETEVGYMTEKNLIRCRVGKTARE